MSYMTKEERFTSGLINRIGQLRSVIRSLGTNGTVPIEIRQKCMEALKNDDEAGQQNIRELELEDEQA